METKEDDDTVFIDANVLIYAKSHQEKLTKKGVTPALLEDVREFAKRFGVAGEDAEKPLPVTERLLWLRRLYHGAAARGVGPPPLRVESIATP